MNWRQRAGGGRASGFGLASSTGGAPRLTTSQAVVMITLVAVLVGAVAAFAVVGDPESASRPQLIGGSVLLENDGEAPTVVDLATAQPTMRLKGIGRAVGRNADRVGLVAAPHGTWVFDPERGSFNLIGRDNLVVARRSRRFDSDATKYAMVAAGDGAWLLANDDGATTPYFLDDQTVRFGTDYAIRSAQAYRLASPLTAGDTATVGERLVLLDRADDGGIRAAVSLSPAGDGRERTLDVHEDILRVGPVTALSVAGTDVAVASASPAQVTLLGTTTVVPVPALAGADVIRPVTGGSDTAWFVARVRGAWTLVGIEVATERIVGPHAISTAGDETTLAPPVVQDGKVFTLDTTTGALVRLDAATGRALPYADFTYPKNDDKDPSSLAEQLRNARVLARGNRVIVNAPRSQRALVLTSDRDTPPIVVAKHDAVAVDPTAAPSPDVAALVPKKNDDDDTDADTPPEPGKPKAQNISNVESQDCTRPPAKPQIVALEPGTTTMRVTWTYTPIDPLDCQPQSYEVTARPVGDFRGPDQPTLATGSGQMDFLYTGLRPNRLYSFTVTAVINRKTADSDPRERATNTTGPDPAFGITASAGAGGWNVRWDACAGDACDVPVDDHWQVSWSLCGGGVLTGPTTSDELAPDQHSLAVRLADYPNLVGKSLRFTVTGFSSNGQQTPAAGGGCSEAWRAPNGELLDLQVSSVATGASVSITAAAGPKPGTDPAAAYGFSAPTISLQLDDQPPVPAAQHTFTNVAPGAHTVTAYVTNHDFAPAKLQRTITQHVSWPEITATSALVPRPNRPNNGTLTISLDGTAALQLTVTAAPTLDCGGRVWGADVMAPQPVDASTSALTWRNLDLIQIASDCRLTVRLTQPAIQIYDQTAIDVGAGNPHVDLPAIPDPAPITATWVGNNLRIDGRQTLPDWGTWRLRVGTCGIELVDRGMFGPISFAGNQVDASCVGQQLDLWATYLGQLQHTFVTVQGDAPTTTTTDPDTTPTTIILG